MKTVKFGLTTNQKKKVRKLQTEQGAAEAAREVLGRIDSLKKEVDPDVWTEINRLQSVRDLREHGLLFTVPEVNIINGEVAPDKLKDPRRYEFSPDNMVEQIKSKAEKKISERKRFASYGKMTGQQLLEAYCSSPEIQQDFLDFDHFLTYIIRNYEDSPANQPEVLASLKSLKAEQIGDIIIGLRKSEGVGFEFPTGQVLYNGKDLNISGGLRIEVFKKLSENIGRVVSKEELEGITSRYISYVSNLRTRISQTPFEIQTITGEGYKMAHKPH